MADLFRNARRPGDPEKKYFLRDAFREHKLRFVAVHEIKNHFFLP